LVAACSIAPPRAPDAAAVDRMDVTYGKQAARTIDDPAAIGRFVAFVNAHDDGWYKPLDTFPTPSGRVVCRRGDAVAYFAWLGPNWIGGRDDGEDAKSNRLRTLSDTEAAELRVILGIAE
jgi:hypothetical protein